MPIRPANAPVSWGIQESVELPAGYPYARVLDEIKQAGYVGTELGPYGFLPSNPEKLRQELGERGLTLCSAFVAFQLGKRSALKAGLVHVERSARLISAAGARLLILSDEVVPERSATAGRKEESNRLSWTDSQWGDAVSAIHQVAQICRKLNLGIAFHHHVGTHVETPEEVDRLLSFFPADELGLCLDTGHYAYGGGDVVPFLVRNVARVQCVHLKDIDATRLQEARRKHMDFYAGVRHGVFVPVGQGAVRFADVIALLRNQGFDGWAVVEQDVLEGGRGAAAPLQNATAARDFLRKLGI